jgi:hypothetical protein
MMFDPGDATGISQAMQQLLNSLAKRQEYRRKGMERAAQFTWEKTARQTIAVWEKMLGISTENAAVNGNQAAPLPQAANGVPPVPGNEHRGVEGSCSSASSGKISAPANGKPVTPAGNAAEMGTGIGPVARSASADSECRPLKRGVVWYAPWQNPSGYCSEAFAFAQGIADSVPLEFVEVAKTKSPSFIAGLPPRLGRMLREHLKDQVNASGKIAILHLPMFPGRHIASAARCSRPINCLLIGPFDAI